MRIALSAIPRPYHRYNQVLAKDPPDYSSGTGTITLMPKIAQTLNPPSRCAAIATAEEMSRMNLVELAGRRIYIVHGHQYGVKRGFEQHYYRGLE